MRTKLWIVAFLFLLPMPGFAQEANSAEELRARNTYRNTLSIFKETQIFSHTNPKIEIYRVLIVPTFYHPLSIRVERNEGEYFLVAKQLSGQGGYGWGKLKREKRRRLSAEEWRTLIDLSNQLSFWTLDPIDKEYEPDEKGETRICLDGTSWYLEALSGGKYHALERYCPESERFRAVGLYLLKLSKWGIRESDVF
jgi:hypothetical protein